MFASRGRLSFRSTALILLIPAFLLISACSEKKEVWSSRLIEAYDVTYEGGCEFLKEGGKTYCGLKRPGTCLMRGEKCYLEAKCERIIDQKCISFLNPCDAVTAVGKCIEMPK